MKISKRPALILPLLGAALLLSGCNSPEEKEANYLKHGNKLFEAGEYQKARLDYMNAAKIKPTDPEVHYRLGLVDEAEGNLKNAYVNYAHAAQQNSHYHPAALKLAEYHMLAGQNDLAQSLIEPVLSEDPNNAEAHGMRALLLTRQKNLSEAETEAKLALSKDPKNTTAISALATVYVQQNDQEKALGVLHDALAQDPRNLSLLLLTAGLYEKSGDIAKLQETYATIFTVAPKDTKYRIKLAVTLASLNHLDEAEKTLRDGIVAYPADTELQHQLVEFLSSHRSMETSEKELRAILAAHPEAPEYYAWLVDLYLSHNALDQAESTLKDFLAHSQSDKQTLAIKTSLARVSFAKNDLTAAKQNADDVLAKDVNNLDALFIRANLEARDGAYQNAIADLRSILRDRPKSPQALGLLTDVLQTEGHLDLAIETFNQLVDINRLNYAARVHLAELYAQNGDAQHAMDILFAVTKEEPAFAPAWQTTARLAINQKNFETADAAITKLDALEGQHEFATYLRGLYFNKSDKPDEAIKSLQAVITPDPMSKLAQRALPALIAIYKDANHLPEAIAYLNSLKSSDPLVQTLLGDCYLTAKDVDQARKAYDIAIAGHPTQQNPYLGRAQILVDDHNIDQALTTLDQAREVAPADPRADVVKGQILTDAQRYPQAIALYEALLDHNPDMEIAANNLAELIADTAYNDPAALEKARLVAERFAASQNPLLLDTLAWVYFRQGRVDQAQALMVRAASLSPDLPAQFHYHYGAILNKAGNPTQAKTELHQAVDSKADYPGLSEAKDLLSKM